MKKIHLDLRNVIEKEVRPQVMVLKERKFVPNDDKLRLDKIDKYIGILEGDSEQRTEELK